MARIILDEDRHGPNVNISVNGTLHTLTTGVEVVVDASVLEAADNAGITYERVYRSTTTQLGDITVDGETTIDDSFTPMNDVFTVVPSEEDSVITMTDTAGGMFALNGLNVVVGDTALTAAVHNIDITETNEEIENSPRVTTIAITVTEA